MECYSHRVDASNPSLYTVKQVAALTGVLETTLRVWERRYGVVTPTRSPGGYRLYSDADVARLRSMAALVADGVPASAAARSVTHQPDAAPAATQGLDELDLVAAAASMDPARLDDVLSRALLQAPVEHVSDAWLLPELARLGRAWESRDLTVAHEHFATAGVTRFLGRVFAETPSGDLGPVLVGLPEKSQHDLGLLAFATCLRRLGVDVAYLGANVPVADWEAVAARHHPRAAVLGAPQGTRVQRAQEVVDRLNALTPPVAVWVGGGLAHRVRGAGRLPDSVAEAANRVATSLRAGRAP